MVDEENPESLKPLIDGGTEGKRKRTLLKLYVDLFRRFQGSSPCYSSDYFVLL